MQFKISDLTSNRGSKSDFLLNTSIAAFIVSLSKKYTDTTGYITKIAKTIIVKKDDSLKKAWAFIQEIMKEEPNADDILTYWDQGKEITITLQIREIVACVFAALGESSKFVSGRPQKVDSQILYESLWSTFSSLFEAKEKNHEAIRNSLVMLLHKVYPKAYFYSIKNDLEPIIINHNDNLLQNLELPLKSPQEYSAFLIAEIKMQRSPAFQKFIEEKKTELETQLLDFFQNTHVSPTVYKKEISYYLDSAGNFSIQFIKDQNFLALEYFLSRKVDTSDKTLRNVALTKLQALVDSGFFDVYNEEHLAILQNFNALEETWDLFKSAPYLSRWKGNKEFVESFYKEIQKKYNEIINNNFFFLDDNFFNLHTYFFQKKIEYEKESVWLGNFFSNWDKELCTLMWKKVNKYFNDSVKNHFDIDMYLSFLNIFTDLSRLNIYDKNIIILHALTFPVEQWSTRFYDALSAINIDNSEVLNLQVNFLKYFYLFIRNEISSNVESSPLKEYFFRVQNPENLDYILDLPRTLKLSSKILISLLIHLDKNCRPLITDFNDFKKLLLGIEKNSFEHLLMYLGEDRLNKIIKDKDTLTYFLSISDRETVFAFTTGLVIRSLGKDHLLGLVKTGVNIYELLPNFLLKERLSFLQPLGVSYLQSIIDTPRKLDQLLSYFSKKDAWLLIEFLGPEHIQKIANSNKTEGLFLANIISKYIDEKNQMEFLIYLGKESLEIAQNNSGLTLLFESLCSEALYFFLNQFKINNYAFFQTIGSLENFIKLFMKIKEFKISDQTYLVLINRLQDLIKNKAQLDFALRSLDRKSISDFLFSREPGYLNTIIQNYSALVILLKRFPKEESMQFLLNKLKLKSENLEHFLNKRLDDLYIITKKLFEHLLVKETANKLLALVQSKFDNNFDNLEFYDLLSVLEFEDSAKIYNLVNKKNVEIFEQKFIRKEILNRIHELIHLHNNPVHYFYASNIKFFDIADKTINIIKYLLLDNIISYLPRENWILFMEAFKLEKFITQTITNQEKEITDANPKIKPKNLLEAPKVSIPGSIVPEPNESIDISPEELEQVYSDFLNTINSQENNFISETNILEETKKMPSYFDYVASDAMDLEVKQSDLNLQSFNLNPKNTMDVEDNQKEPNLQDFILDQKVEMEEINPLAKTAKNYGYACTDLAKNGNCFYLAVAVQFNNNLSLGLNSKEIEFLARGLRNHVCDHIEKNIDIFRGFFEGSFDLKTQRKDGVYAEYVSVVALCYALNVNVIVIRDDSTLSTIKLPNSVCTLFLGYQTHHYQSLNPLDTEEDKINQKNLNSLVNNEPFYELYGSPAISNKDELKNMMKKLSQKEEIQGNQVGFQEALNLFLKTKKPNQRVFNYTKMTNKLIVNYVAETSSIKDATQKSLKGLIDALRADLKNRGLFFEIVGPDEKTPGRIEIKTNDELTLNIIQTTLNSAEFAFRNPQSEMSSSFFSVKNTQTICKEDEGVYCRIQ